MPTLNSRIDRIERHLRTRGVGQCVACDSIPNGIRVYSRAERDAALERIRTLRQACTCGNAVRRHVRITVLLRTREVDR